MRDGLVVVTGAGGFIGHALVAHFHERGRLFRALVREHGPVTALPARHHVVSDLTSVADDELDALLGGATVIVHLAGRVHVMRERVTDPEAEYRAANVIATKRLAQAAVRAGVERFIFASSVKVNGERTPPGRPFRPDDAPAPHDAYARSKLEAERELVGICAGSSLVPVILRLPLVYGPGVGGNFLTLLDEIARERTLPLGAIRNRRSVLGLGNLVDAIDAVIDAPVAARGVHFVADGESVSVPELARAIAAALRVPIRLRAIPVPLLKIAAAVTGRRATVERLINSLEVDTSSFTAATGWRPTHTLAEGLEDTTRWWRLRHSI
jgi:nucleoside-diphosphate-sugar epimerase